MEYIVQICMFWLRWRSVLFFVGCFSYLYTFIRIFFFFFAYTRLLIMKKEKSFCILIRRKNLRTIYFAISLYLEVTSVKLFDGGLWKYIRTLHNCQLRIVDIDIILYSYFQKDDKARKFSYLPPALALPWFIQI